MQADDQGREMWGFTEILMIVPIYYREENIVPFFFHPFML